MGILFHVTRETASTFYGGAIIAYTFIMYQVANNAETIPKSYFASIKTSSCAFLPRLKLPPELFCLYIPLVFTWSQRVWSPRLKSITNSFVNTKEEEKIRYKESVPCI